MFWQRIHITTMKTKTLLTLLLSWTMAAGVMAEEQSALFVHLKDGSKVQFVLPVQEPVVTCQNGTMSVDYLEEESENSHQTVTVQFQRDEVESLTVETVETVAINALPSDGTQRIRFDLTRAGVVRISGLEKTDRLQVYSLDGKSIDAAVTQHDGGATVDLSQQRRGVYMVSVNQRFTFKLTKP